MKKEIREKYRLIRKNIIDKDKKDMVIFNKVIGNDYVIKSKVILCYVSNYEEVDTINLIKYFLDCNKLVAVPKTNNDMMNFYYIKGLEELRKGKYDILEPITNNIVKDYTDVVCITPGICFSKNHHRLGYGKGFYDRFLNANKVYSIGLCYKECYLDYLIPSEYDKEVDEVITN